MSRADVRMTRVAADEIGVEIKLHQLRVVVEHFFEMRHEPFGIHGVTRETAAELIMDAARRHLLAGVQNHFDALRRR